MSDDDQLGLIETGNRLKATGEKITQKATTIRHLAARVAEIRKNQKQNKAGVLSFNTVGGVPVGCNQIPYDYLVRIEDLLIEAIKAGIEEQYEDIKQIARDEI